MLQRQPEKLLLISTGNITNAELERIFIPNVTGIVATFEVADFVELNRTGVVVHG
jgi:predicted nuclease of predicted toxin-antitoxin system